ncbi:hypothetical protein [Bacillus pumilus]|uniref:hypothetical protein n=1 Tax=Bacillus pumilus TaxID=1408 RepID=UPI000DE0078C|nr:hypothetical protein [Bacillus pumilus]
MCKKLIIKDLYIFSISEKKAKHVHFENGINVVTASMIDGNKRGKSIVLKTLYHTLGADSIFDAKWNIKDKINILLFCIDNEEYYILRTDKFFKIFNKEKKLLYSTTKTGKLADFLYNLFDFKVKLPKRKTAELVTAPPAFAYLLNNISQDGMNGSKFTSFDKLQQFSNYKENLLYCHFGVFNDTYFALINEINDLNNKKNILQTDIELIEGLLNKIEKDSNDVVSVPIENINSLELEIKKKELEYKNIYQQLIKSKQKLMEYRSVKIELENSIIEIKEYIHKTNKDLKIINKEHICPQCNSYLEDPLLINFEKNNELEDYNVISSSNQLELADIMDRIESEEKKYLAFLEKADSFTSKLNIDKKTISDILKLKAFSEMKTSLLDEYSQYKISLKNLERKIKEKRKIKKNFDDQKTEINNMYYREMLKDKLTFGLEEVTDENIRDVTSQLSAGGSNTPIITIIWHFNLLKVKNEFNKEAIKFPVLLDSPNNAEIDENNKEKLFKYLFENIIGDTQCILSTLGFNSSKYNQINKEFNVIELKNPKYKLLNENDYLEYYELFDELLNKTIDDNI